MLGRGGQCDAAQNVDIQSRGETSPDEKMQSEPDPERGTE